MKKYKSKKFNNEGKFFYEEKQKAKYNQLRSSIFLYIFNNLEEFCDLIKEIKEEHEETSKKFFFFYNQYIGWNLKSSQLFDLDKYFVMFFNDLKDFKINNCNCNLRKNILSIFYEGMSISSLEEDAIRLILIELKENPFFLNVFKKNMDFDLYFDLCIRYPKLRKYCPSSLKSDLSTIIKILDK